MKRILIAMMMLLLAVSGIAFTSDKAEAAGKTMYVNAKSDVILRDKPAKDAKQITKVKNKTAVTVLSTTKEWSHIQVGKHKGYVYSSALSTKDPNKKVAPVVTEGLYPEFGSILTYGMNYDGYVECVFEVSQGEYRLMQGDGPPGSCGFAWYIEDVFYNRDSTEHIMFASVYSDTLNSYKYPMKEGSHTLEYVYAGSGSGGLEVIEKTKILVESTSKTIKVKAGTFKNVVILKYPDNSRLYFVKGIGLIKQTDAKGKTVMELVSIKK